MLTPNAMTGFKEYVKRTIAYAQYKVNNYYYKAEITNIYIDAKGKVVIDIAIDPAMGNSITITEVQLYDTSGALWLSKTESITRKSRQHGVFYRFTIDIREV